MSGLATVGGLVVGVLLLLGNAFFVVSEFAMTRVRQFPREEFTGNRGLERAWEMTDRLEIYLSGCQVGITICSVGLGYVAEPALAALLDPAVKALGLSGLVGGSEGGHAALSVLLALALINMLHIVVGEQAPTYLGVERTKGVCTYCAYPLWIWTRVMYPVIVVADRIAKALLGVFGVTIERSWAEEEAGDDASSRAVLRKQMGERLSGLVSDEERKEEVLAALDIERMAITSVMVPREDVIALSADASLDENMRTIGESPHARFPLVGDSLSDFRGVVYTPAVLRELDALEEGECTFEDITAPPMTLDAEVVVSDAIDRFQEERQELALIVDDGEVVGLVTATDCFEAITGDLEDPLDADGDDPVPETDTTSTAS
ncbi:CNNM domain-containing protein [Halomarina pelagica]|uniref:CNNM domain-containing protein n=1 Tax=Halomarina pelagica TaxID=2961599 RepID=UPI0020C3DEA7|nr:hemolysin family protein [Halomarina sp. BND7]